MPDSIGTLGGTRPSAGFFRPYPRQWSSTITRYLTTGTSPSLGLRRYEPILGGTRRSPVLTSPTGSTNTLAISRRPSLLRIVFLRRSRKPKTQDRSFSSSPTTLTERPRGPDGASIETSVTRG